jgi:hypothetical protein
MIFREESERAEADKKRREAEEERERKRSVFIKVLFLYLDFSVILKYNFFKGVVLVIFGISEASYG